MGKSWILGNFSGLKTFPILNDTLRKIKNLAGKNTLGHLYIECVMSLHIERANESDVEELIGLYVSIYGKDYPLELGTNAESMKKAIEDHEGFLWLVMRDTEANLIAGSIIFELDYSFKIGKVMGAVVSKFYQGQKVATRLIKQGVSTVFSKDDNGLYPIHSLYATARTIGLSSQFMLINSGFSALGIFPNARKIKTYESLTLLGMFAPGVLNRRASLEKVSDRVQPILEICNNSIGSKDTLNPEIVSFSQDVEQSEDATDDEFEFIFAPSFVEKRFSEKFAEDRESIFYPFHKPNLIISSVKTNMEIYASFNKKDHYCVLITANESIKNLSGKFKNLVFSMKELGIYYIETLVRMDYFETIGFLLENRFLPSAVYPAMREEDGEMHDYILLTRTMVPLDFSDASIHPAFNAYVYEYVKQWLHLNLSIVEGVSS